MGMLDGMVTWFAQAMIGEEVTAFDDSNAYICVGDSDAEFNSAQTNLQAVTNKVRVGMDNNFPARVGYELEFQATFGEEVANWVWKEWGIANHASAGTLANRKVENKGTKNGGSWVLNVKLALVIGTPPA